MILKDQWNGLVLQPLYEPDAGSFQAPLLIVIDALDECEKKSDVKQVLHLLSVKENSISGYSLQAGLKYLSDMGFRSSQTRIVRISYFTTFHGPLLIMISSPFCSMPLQIFGGNAPLMRIGQERRPSDI